MHIPAWPHIKSLFRRQRRLLGRFVVTSLGESVLTMAGILLVKEFLSGVLGGDGGMASRAAEVLGPNVALWIVAGLLLGTYVGASLLRYDNAVTQQRIVKVLELGVMGRLIRQVLSLSVSFVERQSHGDIIQAVRSDVAALREVVLAYARIFLDGMVAVGLLFAAITLSPALTLYALMALPLGVFPLLLIGRATREKSFEVRETRYALFDAVLQILRGIRVTKVYHGEGAAAREAVQKGSAHFDALIEMVRIRAMSQVVLRSLSGLSLVIVVVAGGFQVMSGALSWPSLLAFLMAVRALHAPLNSVNGAYVQVKRQGAALDRIRDLLGELPEVADLPGAIPKELASGHISFDRVRFSYGGKDVLRGVSFDVAPGETIGIAGPSGAGKSTILSLVARFYDPADGSVRADGRNLREYRLADVYQSVAIVTQQPFLFSASVLDNIACGRPGASFAEIVEAAQAAEIHDEILALENGYDTLLGRGGREISVGQAQRVNIARALLKEAPILLLDEATASLDSLSEERVQRAIDHLMEGRTTFIVAHRLSTLRGADRILVLEDGKLVASGGHEDLLLDCPLYYRLWETQHLGFTSPDRVPGIDESDRAILTSASAGARTEP
jgi:ABC-type multidrug transport system fused ATPase/permease subunit